jgi:hypothetical protein
LKKAALFESDSAPTSKFGGVYTIVYQPSDAMQGHWIQLGAANGGGLLTPKQAQKLMSKIDGGTLATAVDQGLLRVMNGSNTNSCILNGVLNLDESNGVCVIYMRL